LFNYKTMQIWTKHDMNDYGTLHAIFFYNFYYFYLFSILHIFLKMKCFIEVVSCGKQLIEAAQTGNTTAVEELLKNLKVRSGTLCCTAVNT